MSEIRLTSVLGPAFHELAGDVFRHEHTHYDLSGGRGSLKSSCVSLLVPLLLILNPGTHAVVLRKVANTIRDSVFAQYIWAVDALGMSSYWEAKMQRMELIYKPTGQKIMFRGADDPMKIKSIKVPFGYIAVTHFEEKDQFTSRDEIRNILQSTMRGGAKFWNFESYNPPAMARNWANRDSLEQRKDRLCHRSTYLEAQPEWLGEQFLLEAKYLQETNETAYRHQYLGEVVGSGSAVFENLRLEPIADKQIAAFDYHYFGQDWGWYPDPNHFSGCAYEGGVLYIYEEFRGWRQSNAAWAEKIRHHMDDLILADPGSGGDRNVGDFKAYGFRMREAQKGPGSVAYGIKWLQSLKAIVIDPERCPETAKEFSEYEYERDPKTGEVLEGYPDAANHSIDAVRYALEPVWKRRGR